MSTTILEKPKTTTRKRRVTNNVTQSSISPKKKKKTLWEVALELQKNYKKKNYELPFRHQHYHYLI